MFCSEPCPRTQPSVWDMQAGAREALVERRMVVMTHRKKLKMEDSEETLYSSECKGFLRSSPLLPDSAG